MRVKDILGRYGEERAAAYLADKGYTIIERNWRVAGGEVDLIARDGDTLVIVEVKTRRSDSHGHPFEAIDARKLARLRMLAAQWLKSSGEAAARIRIDVVAVWVPRRGLVSFDHLEGAAA